MNEKKTYATRGVKCDGCVKKITSHLHQKDPNAVVEVEIEQQQLTLGSTLDDVQVKAILGELDYLPNDEEMLKNTVKIRGKQHTTQNGIHQKTVKLALSGMTCASCVKAVDIALHRVAGVAVANINFANRTANVVGTMSETNLIDAVKQSGYAAEVIVDNAKAEDQRLAKDNKEYHIKLLHSWIGIGAGAMLMAYDLLGGEMQLDTSLQRLAWAVVGLLCLGIMLATGLHFYCGAWKQLKRRSSNMDTLIALGTGTAWMYSMAVVVFTPFLPMESKHLYFESAVMIIGLINLGQALDIKARGKTSQAVRRLLNLRTKTAHVIRDGKTIEMPIEDVILGDFVRVRAGENIPVDGVITEGESYLDESMLTGESMPVKKGQSDKVTGGTLNGQGSFVLQAAQIGEETTLSKIIAMIESAQNSKPPISQLADKIASIFVPSVIIIAILTAIAWLLFGSEQRVVQALVAATAVLIIACPCALGLATPISTMIGVGKLAEQGGLIRSGSVLQKATDISVVVLDKTGTITQGHPEVTGFVWVEGAEQATLLSQVKTLEIGSSHPLAEALLRYCKGQSTLPNMRDFRVINGQGVSAKINNQSLYLGNKRLLQNAGIVLEKAPEKILNQARQWENAANTVIFFAVDNNLQAIFAVSDPIREEAKNAIKALHKQHISIVMLTGDNWQTAKAIAEQVGIDELQAECLPEDKLQQVKMLQQKGLTVAVVGDGINDAPALAIADVGFAIGSGTDVAIESADIVLINNDLNGISKVIDTSEKTLKNIKQNLWGAFAYNMLGIPLAAGLLYPWTGWLLSPMIAALAMSLSSLTVVSNANRLRSIIGGNNH
ncbi:MAG: heavy metal translocating P-type ATPase [Ostreibacterium sp.]